MFFVCIFKNREGGEIMAKSATLKTITKNTGINRFTSGAATKNSKNAKNGYRRKSNGGKGG